MTRLFALLAVLLALSLTACDSADVDDDGPAAPQSIAGVWEGTLTHPDRTTISYRLELTQVDRSVTGTAVWRYTTGGNDNNGTSGSVLGTVPQSGPITFTISFQDSDRQFHEMTLANGTMSGTWTSSGRRTLNGTSSLTRR